MTNTKTRRPAKPRLSTFAANLLAEWVRLDLPLADASIVIAVSGGADWGNVRYGKGFRTSQALDAIARHTDLATPLALLDVGSNRLPSHHSGEHGC